MDKKSVWKEIQKIKDPVVRAYLENAVQEQTENTTLKKQINLMAKYIVAQGNVDINLCDDIPDELHLKYQPKNDGNYENEPCIQCVQEHFRQQAQQLTHGEAEK